MRPFSVVIDNDSLIHLTFINCHYPIFNGLRSIFSSMHVPEEVFIEFQNYDRIRDPERQKIIAQIDSNSKFLRKCSIYDTISKAFMQSAVGIDPGEAAAVAQFQKLSARFIISEDGKFHENAPKLYPGITIIKLKHVFAMLDINNLIDWALCISLLHKKRKMTSSELRIAYLSVAKWYGLEISGKKLSEKTSLKKLGLI